jgi:hypothetical protein
VVTHSTCYGLPHVYPTAAGSAADWLCDACVNPSTAGTVACCLCCDANGALKPTDDGRWAHIYCATWMPEGSFPNPATMAPIAGLARVEPLRFKLACALCAARQQGACVQCHVKNCRQAFHPRCARRHGLKTEVCGGDSPYYCIFMLNLLIYVLVC